MEHRTLRQNNGVINNIKLNKKSLEFEQSKTKSLSTIFQSSLKSFDNLSSTNNNNDQIKSNENNILPSPPKITPYSGIKPTVSYFITKIYKLN